jgi:hypothetical protein
MVARTFDGKAPVSAHLAHAVDIGEASLAKVEIAVAAPEGKVFELAQRAFCVHTEGRQLRKISLSPAS